MSIRFFDMFAGIGGFRSGLEAVGGFECIGHCEIDKYANQAYNAIYEPKGELYFEDARKINPKDLPNIVEQQLWKTYIITAMAIIECIFNSIVKKNGKQLINEWSDGIELDTNEIIQNDITKKCKVIMYEKLQTPIDVEMKFFQLIDIVEKKRLISFRTKGYEDLRTLKNIRNRIHLSASEMNDTDYYKIEKGHYLLSRRYLYFVITNEKLYSSPQTSFDFIKLSEKENKEADAYLKKMEEN